MQEFTPKANTQSPTLPAQTFARLISEASFVVKVNIESQSYEILGLSGKFPDALENLAPENIHSWKPSGVKRQTDQNSTQGWKGILLPSRL
jgi:hypothetical protein